MALPLGAQPILRAVVVHIVDVAGECVRLVVSRLI